MIDEGAGRSHPEGGSERSFGLSIGTVLCVAAGFLAWRGRPLRAEVLGATGATLVLLGAVWPSLLRWPNVLWWRLARALAYVNTRVLLTALFILVLVPIGLIWRLLGSDPLARRRATWSGWSPYPIGYRDRGHYRRMY